MKREYNELEYQKFGCSVEKIIFTDTYALYN